MSSISDRIKQLVDRFADGNNSKFAKMVDTSEANVRNYISGTQPKFDFLQSVAEKFEISCEWLLLGRGELKAIEHLGVRSNNYNNTPKAEIDDLKLKLARTEKLNYYLIDEVESLKEELGIYGIKKCDKEVG